MKIVHIDFTGPFTEDAGYQENYYININAEDGHETVMITGTSRWVEGAIKEVYEKRCRYYLPSGAQIIRLPFKKFFCCSWLGQKIRAVSNLYSLLVDLHPEVIFVHCLQTWETVTVCKYIKRHPSVIFIGDNHADVYNSARSFCSKYFLHKMFYGSIIRYSYNYIDKILCISPETKDFMIDVYNVCDKKLELMSLGGIVKNIKQRNEIKQTTRKAYDIPEDCIVYLHAGKMNNDKKTVELIKTFSECRLDNCIMLLVGALDNAIKEEVEFLLSRNKNIWNLGWKTSTELDSLLCAADIYIQPGSQSAIAQVAVCNGIPVILSNVKNYKWLVRRNGWLINSIDDLIDIFFEIQGEPTILDKMSRAALDFASKNLDYRKQMQEIYRFANDFREI